MRAEGQGMRWWQRGRTSSEAAAPTSTRAQGLQAESQALSYLQAQGLQLLARNYKTPGRGGGEIDLIMRTADATVVFVEVRSRSQSSFGGAGASISARKRQRIVLAAQHWLLQTGAHSACRFDVVLFEGAHLQWLPGAFEVA